LPAMGNPLEYIVDGLAFFVGSLSVSNVREIAVWFVLALALVVVFKYRRRVTMLLTGDEFVHLTFLDVLWLCFTCGGCCDGGWTVWRCTRRVCCKLCCLCIDWLWPPHRRPGRSLNLVKESGRSMGFYPVCIKLDHLIAGDLPFDRQGSFFCVINAGSSPSQSTASVTSYPKVVHWGEGKVLRLRDSPAEPDVHISIRELDVFGHTEVASVYIKAKDLVKWARAFTKDAMTAAAHDSAAGMEENAKFSEEDWEMLPKAMKSREDSQEDGTASGGTTQGGTEQGTRGKKGKRYVGYTQLKQGGVQYGTLASSSSNGAHTTSGAATTTPVDLDKVAKDAKDNEYVRNARGILRMQLEPQLRSEKAQPPWICFRVQVTEDIEAIDPHILALEAMDHADRPSYMDIPVREFKETVVLVNRHGAEVNEEPDNEQQEQHDKLVMGCVTGCVNWCNLLLFIFVVGITGYLAKCDTQFKYILACVGTDLPGPVGPKDPSMFGGLHKDLGIEQRFAKADFNPRRDCSILTKAAYENYVAPRTGELRRLSYAEELEMNATSPLLFAHRAAAARLLSGNGANHPNSFMNNLFSATETTTTVAPASTTATTASSAAQGGSDPSTTAVPAAGDGGASASSTSAASASSSTTQAPEAATTTAGQGGSGDGGSGAEEDGGSATGAASGAQDGEGSGEGAGAGAEDADGHADHRSAGSQDSGGAAPHNADAADVPKTAEDWANVYSRVNKVCEGHASDAYYVNWCHRDGMDCDLAVFKHRPQIFQTFVQKHGLWAPHCAKWTCPYLELLNGNFVICYLAAGIMLFLLWLLSQCLRTKFSRDLLSAAAKPCFAQYDHWTYPVNQEREMTNLRRLCGHGDWLNPCTWLFCPPDETSDAGGDTDPEKQQREKVLDRLHRPRAFVPSPNQITHKTKPAE